MKNKKEKIKFWLVGVLSLLIITILSVLISVYFSPRDADNSFSSKFITTFAISGLIFFVLGLLLLFILNILFNKPNKNLRKLENELNEIKEQNKNNEEISSNFLYNVSHEIRTHANNVNGQIILARSATTSDKKNQTLNSIIESSNKLLEFLDNIIDIAKIQGNKLVLEPTSFNIEEMILKIANSIQNGLKQKNIYYSAHIDKHIPLQVVQDQSRLMQVIQNLLDNAIRYSNDYGTITLEMQLVGNHDDYLLIETTIKDNGIGISDEQQLTLFANNKNTNSFGLIISKSIIELMEGTIKVKSRIGEGSTFTFTIKAKQDTNYSDLAFSKENIKILLISNDEQTSDKFSNISAKLKLSSHLLFQIDNLDKKIAEINPNIILIDDSFDNYLKISQNLIKLSNVKIIYLCDQSTQELVEESFVNPIILNKPFTINEFVAVLSKSVYEQNKVSNDDIIYDNYENKTVLLVDDIEINNVIIKYLLEPTKIKIVIAHDGREAINLFKSFPEKYDIIFMDMQMPELDGVSATRVIRDMEIAKAKKIPIIALTANTLQESIDECLHAGMNAHISKPINLSQLLKILKKYLK
jgi:signal transduction histidine kinase/CheY-like chemotaxis protein